MSKGLDQQLRRLAQLRKMELELAMKFSPGWRKRLVRVHQLDAQIDVILNLLVD